MAMRGGIELGKDGKGVEDVEGVKGVELLRSRVEQHLQQKPSPQPSPCAQGEGDGGQWPELVQVQVLVQDIATVWARQS